MKPAEMIAEAERLEAEAERLTDEASARAIAAGRLDPRASLLCCAASLPLTQRAARLRGAAAPQISRPPDIVAGPAPTPAPTLLALARASSSANLTREQKLETIAAGAPFPLPAGMLASAMTDATTVEAFALAVADHCVVARAVAKEGAEVDILVARILASEAIARGHAAPRSDVDTIAVRIAAA